MNRTPTEEAFWSRNSKPTSTRKLKKLAELYQMDLRSITALFSSYLDFDCREDRPTDGGAILPDAEHQHLVEANVVPATRAWTASELMAWLSEEVGRSDRAAISRAFIIGVATGRYDYTSALGSFASFESLLQHDACPEDVAGLPEEGEAKEHHFLYYAFRRLWKPYVFHDTAPYAAFDLSRFNAHEPREPAEAERDSFRQLLNAIRSLPESARLTELQKSGSKLIKGNKYDRQHALEVLGYCGVLPSLEHEPLETRYLCQLHRPMPKHFYAREWRFPACLWSGSVGVDEEAIEKWFPGFEV